MYGKYDVPPGSDKCVPSDAVAQWEGGGRLVGGRLGGWLGGTLAGDIFLIYFFY